MLATIVILLGCESCETFIIDVDSKGVDAGDSDVDTHVELVAV